ncbi:MAG: hypothetical protein HYY06_29310 [Deltaproteobacteria bacterium]|nr:hypothetical protein [Deltaproteobacteria bacterium]
MTRSSRAIAASAVLFVYACGGETPPTTPTTGDYFPVASGSRWTYTETRPEGGPVTLEKEISACESVTFADCETGEPRTFEASRHESIGSNDPEENGISYLVGSDDGILRVLQDMFDNCDTGTCDLEFQQRYSPGFLRFPSGDLGAGRSIGATHTRCEIDCHAAEGACEERGAAHAEAMTIEEKRYDWTIDLVEDVSVPAGEFTALRMTRVNGDTGETKRYWFAQDVGKVLEQEVDGETVRREEKLESYEIGTTTCGS